MPMYIAEISPPNVRGRLVMINQFNIVFGVLLCGVSNYLVADLLSRGSVCLAVDARNSGVPVGDFFFLLVSHPRQPPLAC